MPESPKPTDQSRPDLRRIRRIQRTALALLLLCGVINFVDRSSLAVGLPLIRRDLGLTVADSGFLLSAFLAAYAFAQLPAGIIADRLGGRLMLSTGLGLWSLAQILGGLAGNFRQFVSVRILLGVGESPHFPTCARISADWFPKRERGGATGVWNCASSLGNAIAVPLLTFLMVSLGWRWMFASVGIAGLLIALLAYAVHRNPGQVALTAGERAYLADNEETAPRLTLRGWVRLFRFRTTWGMILGFFGLLYLIWLYYAWLPQYLEIEWHFSIARTGWVAAIPFLCGVAGSFLGGRVCDLLLHRGFSPIASRKAPFLCALAGTVVCTVLAAYASSGAAAVAFISLSVFLTSFASTAAWATVTVAADRSCTASLGSIQNFGGYIGGALAPAVTGLLVQKTGSFRIALLVAAGVAASAALAHLVLVKDPIAPELPGKTPPSP